MAGAKIRGITIELGADTQGFTKALKDVDSQLKTTQANLKDINKLLKMDPGNTELLQQKQKNLADAVDETKQRLEELKKAQGNLKEGSAEWDAMQREIIATEQKLEGLEKEYRNFGSVSSQQIKAAGESMKDLGGKISDVGNKLAPLSGAAAGALTALGGVALKAVQSADELNTLSKQTGISTAELQKMQYASELVDVSVEDMTGALRKLKPKITDDNKVLAELGVSVRDADGNLRDATDVFYDSLEALSQIENETERDQRAMELFGKGADQLAGIIDDGGQSLKEYGKQAEDLGIILDEETLESLGAIDDTIQQLKVNVGGSLATLGATLAETFAPLLGKISEILSSITEKIRNLSPEQAEMITKILGVIAVVGPALAIGGKLITMIGGVVSAIGTVVGILGGPLTLAIAAIIAIGVLLYKHWDEVKEFAINAWTALKDGVTDAVERLKTGILNLWTNIKTGVNNTVENIKNNVTTKWNTMKTTVTDVMSAMKSTLSTVWDAIKDTVGRKVDSIRDNIRSRFESLRDTLSNIVDRIKNLFNFNFRIPHLSLPHLSITWEAATGPIGQALQKFFNISGIPHLNVQWYRKAYENAVMFTQPTVLATPSGLKGFGDGNGAEITLGLNKLQELVGASQPVVINVYGSSGMDTDALADRVAQRFIALNRQRKAAGI